MDAGQIDARLTELAERIERVEARNRELAAENEALRAVVGAPPATDSPDVVDRRGALKAGLAAAAGAAGALLVGAEPAAAADGGNVILGTPGNVATSATGLRVNGTDLLGFGVGDNNTLTTSTNNPAIIAYAAGEAFDTGVESIASGAAVAGRFQSSTGFAGRFVANGSDAVFVRSAQDDGIHIEAGRSHLKLTNNGFRYPPTSAGTWEAGEMMRDSNGDLWWCGAGGTPGTWRKLGGPTSAGALHVLPTPARAYDSRPGTQPNVGSKTKLSGNTARAIDLKVNSTGVPAGATAALLTILLVDAAATAGNFTLWATGSPRPQANTMVWGGSAGRFTTSAVTALDAQARCNIAASAPTNIVVDVVGYYR